MKAKPRTLEAILGSALAAVPNPAKGLPEAVFRFVLKLTPMINVDLLVRNERGEHLLAWREDDYGKGWHVPGGIVRFQEPIEHRIAAVARNELSTEVEHGLHPIDVRQLCHVRGHFISLLYLCTLKSPVGDSSLWYTAGNPRRGQIFWWHGIPAHLYPVHDMYAQWLDGRAT